MTLEEAKKEILDIARKHPQLRYDLPLRNSRFGDDRIILKQAMDLLVKDNLATKVAPGHPDGIILRS